MMVRLYQRSSSDTRNSGGNTFLMKGAKLPWSRWKMDDVLFMLKFVWQKSGKFFGLATEAGAILKTLRYVSS